MRALSLPKFDSDFKPGIMKKINLFFQFSTLTSLMVAGIVTFALAQQADDSDQRQKLTIDIEVIENGKVTKISKEVDALEGEDIHQILKDLDVMDDLDIRGTGQKLEIKVRKEMKDDTDRNIDVHVFSPDDDLEWEDRSLKFEARPMLGVYISTYQGDDNTKGALITSVIEASAAQKAALQEGDIITRINNTDISNDAQLRELIGSYKIGEKVSVTYQRNGKTNVVEVELGESSSAMNFNQPPMPNGNGHFFFKGDMDDEKIRELLEDHGRFNFDFEAYTDDNAAFLGVTPRDESADVRGVMLGEVIAGSAAEKMGLKPDDCILKLDGKKVNRFSQLAEVIASKKPGDEITVEYERKGKPATAKGELGKRADAPQAKRIIRMGPGNSAPSGRTQSTVTKEVNVVIELKDCSKEDEAVLAAPAKVDFSKELGINRIEFSPNPSNGQFQLNFELPERQNTRVMVLDGMGRKVHEELLNNFDGQYSNRIDIGSQPDGVYFLIIAQGDKQFTRKIVKQ